MILYEVKVVVVVIWFLGISIVNFNLLKIFSISCFCFLLVLWLDIKVIFFNWEIVVLGIKWNMVCFGFIFFISCLKVILFVIEINICWGVKWIIFNIWFINYGFIVRIMILVFFIVFGFFVVILIFG